MLLSSFSDGFRVLKRGGVGWGGGNFICESLVKTTEAEPDAGVDITTGGA